MGDLLREEVSRQLINDLHHYGSYSQDLSIDWSHTMADGHYTDYLDGY